MNNMRGLCARALSQTCRRSVRASSSRLHTSSFQPLHIHSSRLLTRHRDSLLHPSFKATLPYRSSAPARLLSTTRPLYDMPMPVFDDEIKEKYIMVIDRGDPTGPYETSDVIAHLTSSETLCLMRPPTEHSRHAVCKVMSLEEADARRQKYYEMQKEQVQGEPWEQKLPGESDGEWKFRVRREKKGRGGEDGIKKKKKKNADPLKEADKLKKQVEFTWRCASNDSRNKMRSIGEFYKKGLVVEIIAGRKGFLGKKAAKIQQPEKDRMLENIKRWIDKKGGHIARESRDGTGIVTLLTHAKPQDKVQPGVKEKKEGEEGEEVKQGEEKEFKEEKEVNEEKEFKEEKEVFEGKEQKEA